MLIKIQQCAGAPNFIIIENVTDVVYYTEPQAAAQWLIGTDVSYHVRHDKDNPAYSQVSFSKDGNHKVICFDGECYICSDTGHTIQKIKALS